MSTTKGHKMLSADQMAEPLEGVEAHDSDDVAAALRSVGDQKAALYVEEQADRIETLEAEVSRLQAAFRAICRPRSGLQRIEEDHGHDANAFNFHAQKYWYEVCAQITAVARAALFPTTEQEGKG